MKRIILCVSAVVFFNACVEEISSTYDEHGSFECLMEQLEDTKTQMDTYNNIRWEKGDKVVVFDAFTVGECYQVADECAGQTSGRFIKVDVSGDFTSGTEIDNVIAYYPYSSSVGCSKSDASYTLTKIEIPSVQSYAKNSFASNTFPMIAVTSSVSEKQLKFRNICGALKLQLTGDVKVRKIILRGNKGELLSGQAMVTASANSLPSINMYDNALTEVTLDCGKDGVQLASDEETMFILTIPPVVFKNGFTIKVVCTDGTYMELSTTKSNTVSRSSILKMPVKSFIPTGVVESPNVNQEIHAGPEGGTFEVKFMSYGNSKVVIPNEAASWISVADTKAMTEETLVLNVAENKSPESRTAVLGVKDSGGDEIGRIAVYQMADEAIQEDMSVFVAEAGALNDMLTENQKNAVKKLTVTGTVNSDDFKAIEGMPSLKELDLSGVKVVADIIPNMAMTNIRSVGSIEWYQSDSNVEKITLPEGLISIGEHAFDGMVSLKDVNIPTTVKQVRQFAFSGTSLESVMIPSGVLLLEKAVFKRCEALKSVTFEAGSKLTRIESSASNDALGNTSAYGVFHTCSSLESINIPSSVSHLGVGTFNNCEALKELVIPEDTRLTSLEGYYYLDANVLGASPVTGGLIEECWNLEKIVIPSKIKKIDKSAFMNSGLRTITFAEGTQCSEIGDYSFAGCPYLESIDIPSTVRTMGNSVFKNCTSLVSLDLTYVENLGESVFGGCSSLKFISLPSNTKEILPSSFKDCASLEECRIPDGVVTIGEKAFSGCSSLKKIPVSTSLQEIGRLAFEKCTALTEVTIPASVRRVGDSAFSKCTSMTEFSLDHQDEIALCDRIIEFCSSLKNINLCAKRIYIGDLFADTPLTSLEIPAEVEFWGGTLFIKYTYDYSGEAYYEWGYYLGENEWMNASGHPFAHSQISTISFEKGSRLKELGTWAFAGAEYLSSLTLPETVETVGTAIFEGCTSLLEWNIPSHVKKITGPVYDASSVLYPMVESPENLEYVGPLGLMRVCNTELDLSNCAYVGDYALFDCPYLSEVKWLSSGVLTLGQGITLSSPNVTEFAIPSGVTAINGNTAPFEGTEISVVSCEAHSRLSELQIGFQSSNITCVDLSNVESQSFVIDGGVDKNHRGAFAGMDNLSELKLPRCVDLYIYSTSSGVELNGIPNIKILEIPETVQSITCDTYSLFKNSSVEEIRYLGSNIRFEGSALFAEMPMLKKVSFPNASTDLIKNMFYGCKSVESIDLPYATSLPASSFSDCSSLASFKIAPTVLSIGEYAFARCNALQELVVPATVVNIDEDAFTNCPANIIYE